MATAIVNPTTEGFNVSVPVSYAPPGGEATDGELRLSGPSLDDLAVQGALLYTDDGGAIATSLQQGGKLMPQLAVVGDQGVTYEDTADQPITLGATLPVRFGPLAPGLDARLGLTITDVADRQARVALPYETR
ncbi:hypothetical protein KSP35_13460 [Aquihabitans sp. G128]|uniref:hypothetical protein n=1 Tax=Aquihabitans sp. G128 TaxID=2849779 RepID=UPI001C226DAB|nr:hypothetical protein [Aquihabitans sp. G128]QXC59407.1 hypothetical protein KSP35_13460 [Aquihabitans sp. G128]